MTRLPFLATLGAAALLTSMTLGAQAQREPDPVPPLPGLIGRWDLTLQMPGGERPSWLQVERSGYVTLVGSFVGPGGSARPISEVKAQGDQFSFEIPVQWERPARDLRVEGRLVGERLEGRFRTQDGAWLNWTGVRAPKLERAGEPQWGEPIELFNGRDLEGWKPRHAGRANGWSVQDGLLRNLKPGNDLLTERRFEDFKLHAEFRYPKGSNSGIYLRGRHELQIQDDYGQEADSHRIGGIYGFLTPRINAARPAGEWQTFDVTLVGRRLTLVVNGETVIDRQVIPGITGGALDSREGEPGPILLQGDHGPIDFRKIILTPAR